MKLWITPEVGKMEMIDVPIPELKPGTVKVKVDYCALCATEVHIVTQDLLHMKRPYGLGHEACGTVVEVSAEAVAKGFRVGDRVAMTSVSNCGHCEACQRGHDQWCENQLLVPKLAEYAVVPLNMAHRIPDSVVDHMPYCLSEPCTCAMRGIDLAEIKVGNTVAISGIGGIGSIILNMMLLRGSARLTVIEPVASKRKMAIAMGVKHVIDPKTENVVERCMEITDGLGFDVMFDASGVPAAAPPLLKSIAKQGTIVYFSLFPEGYELPVNLLDLYKREGRILTASNTCINYPRVIETIPLLQMDKIIGKIMPLDQAKEAFELFEKSIYPKIVIKCS